MGALIASSAQPQGAERSGEVEPHNETTGHFTAAAICIDPQSGPKAAAQASKTATNACKPVRPTKLTRGSAPSSAATACASACSAPVPISTGVSAWRLCIKRATWAIESGKYKRLGQDEPRISPSSGRG